VKYNPFQPNQIVAPGMFTGRTDEVITIERSLFQAKCGNPQHFLIEGERGIGKSSLLFVAAGIANAQIKAMEAPPMKFVVLSVDLGNVTSQLDIVRVIARELRSQIAGLQASAEAARKVWQFLSSWEVLGIRYHKEAPNLLADDARDSLIDQIVQLCGQACGIDGIFIIIDEADTPPAEAGLGEFVKTFTERLTKRGCNNVLLGIAGLPALIGKLRASHESSPRVFSVLRLEPLEPDERMEVVRKGLTLANAQSGAKTEISGDALELLADLSEGYPHFVQQFAFSAFDYDEDNVISADDVLGGAYSENGALWQLGSKYFDEMYYGRIYSDDYRKVLNAMAGHGDSWVARKTLQTESGVKQSTIANALNALKGRGIILSDASRQGFYRLPTKSFAAWINAINAVARRRQFETQTLFQALDSENAG
jgi:hypothetical protein